MDAYKQWVFEDFGMTIEVTERENESSRIDIEDDQYSNVKSVLILFSDINNKEVVSIELENCYICIRTHGLIEKLKKELKRAAKREKNG